MRTHRKVWGVFTVNQLSVITFLVIASLVGFGNHAIAKQPFTLVYYDGHMHTTYSDGSGTVDDIKAIALGRGLDAVIITDHCKYLTPEKWDNLVADTEAVSDGSFLALPGFEVTGDESMLNRDHLLAFNVKDPFVGDDAEELCPEEVWESSPNPAGTGPFYPENLTKWADYIHSKGGIAVHNHTSGTTLLDYGVKNIEIYNQANVDDIIGYAMALGYPLPEAWGFAITVSNFAIYGERDVNMLVPFPGFPTPIPLRSALYIATNFFSGVGQWLGAPEAPLNSWDDLLMGYVDGAVDTPIFGVANSDAHYTGHPQSTVGVAKNGLYVKELTAKEFYKAIKAGRSFATTGPSLALDVTGEMMGDTAEISDGTAAVNISVNSESPTAILVKIDIIKNGEIWRTKSPMSPSYEDSLVDDDVTEDGYYRVEVTSYDVISSSYYFAWSNPVFVIVD